MGSVSAVLFMSQSIMVCKRALSTAESAEDNGGGPEDEDQLWKSQKQHFRTQKCSDSSAIFIGRI